MCFGPESSKYDEQKLCREPSLIQDKQGFDYKYDSGRPWPPNSLICLPRLQTVSPSKPAQCRSRGPLWPALPRTEGVACKPSQLLHHLQCLRAAWSMSSKPELEHTWQVRTPVHKVGSTRNATSLFSWCHPTKLKHHHKSPLFLQDCIEVPGGSRSSGLCMGDRPGQREHLARSYLAPSRTLCRIFFNSVFF